MCSDWLKVESNSTSNSWEFHLITLSIIILKLFSTNISWDLEIFVLFLNFIIHTMVYDSVMTLWSQKAA